MINVVPLHPHDPKALRLANEVMALILEKADGMPLTSILGVLECVKFDIVQKVTGHDR